ncbi:MAG: T9SS type A sorting domain-containing protein, partial [Dolichospermum sp.]
LTLSNGTLSTSGNLYLRSTATNTARVASIAGTGAISGDVTVERFFSNKRAWRFVTAPTFNASTVNLSAGWQTQTHIVGPGGNPMTNGLDADKPGFSFMTYAPNTWTGVNNTTTTTQMLGANGGGAKAFAAFLVGNRSVDVNSATASGSLTLSATGNLLTGTQNINLGTLNANDYYFIANPYASPVNLTNVYNNTGTTQTNLLQTFYTWDPSLSSIGGYVTLMWNGSGYTRTPLVGTNQTEVIQSGQAFFVQANASPSGTTTISFEENDKSATPSVNSVFGIGNGNIDFLGINLNRVNNGSLSVRDGIVVQFGAAYSKQVLANEDANKLFNNDEGITLRRGNKNLSIESRPYVTNTNDTIFLALNRLQLNTNYTLNLNATGWDAGMQAFLVDKLLSTETAINLQAASQDITITSSVATVADRWMIVFRGTGNLPNNKLSLVATKKDKDVQLTWNIANEQGVKDYELQRSVNGIEFTTINNQVASNKAEYNNVDTKANNGINYYRVKMTMLNDDVRYSNVVTINLKLSTVNPVTVYPNPIKGSIAQLQLNELAAGNYTIRLMDMQGKLVQTQNIQHQGGTTSRSLGLGNVAAGNYQLVVEGKGFTHTISVIKSN